MYDRIALGYVRRQRPNTASGILKVDTHGFNALMLSERVASSLLFLFLEKPAGTVYLTFEFSDVRSAVLAADDVATHRERTH